MRSRLPFGCIKGVLPLGPPPPPWLPALLLCCPCRRQTPLGCINRTPPVAPPPLRLPALLLCCPCRSVLDVAPLRVLNEFFNAVDELPMIAPEMSPMQVHWAATAAPGLVLGQGPQTPALVLSQGLADPKLGRGSHITRTTARRPHTNRPSTAHQPPEAADLLRVGCVERKRVRKKLRHSPPVTRAWNHAEPALQVGRLGGWAGQGGWLCPVGRLGRWIRPGRWTVGCTGLVGWVCPGGWAIVLA
eukprot:218281-Chlamydomonas_euryale.AAC.4